MDGDPTFRDDLTQPPAIVFPSTYRISAARTLRELGMERRCPHRRPPGAGRDARAPFRDDQWCADHGVHSRSRDHIHGNAEKRRSPESPGRRAPWRDDRTALASAPSQMPVVPDPPFRCARNRHDPVDGSSRRGRRHSRAGLAVGAPLLQPQSSDSHLRASSRDRERLRHRRTKQDSGLVRRCGDDGRRHRGVPNVRARRRRERFL